MQKKYFIIVSMFFALFSEECVHPKRFKKNVVKEMQQEALALAKENIIESTRVIDETMEVMQNALISSFTSIVKKITSKIREIVEVIDAGEEGVLGASDKEELRAYVQDLREWKATIKKYKNDIHLYRSQSKK
jgi:hypothetical protein